MSKFPLAVLIIPIVVITLIILLNINAVMHILTFLVYDEPEHSEMSGELLILDLTNESIGAMTERFVYQFDNSGGEYDLDVGFMTAWGINSQENETLCWEGDSHCELHTNCSNNDFCTLIVSTEKALCNSDCSGRFYVSYLGSSTDQWIEFEYNIA